MAKLSKKALAAKLNAAYGKVGNGVVVDIFDLIPIHKAGEVVALAGGTDAEIEAAMAAVLAKVRVN